MLAVDPSKTHPKRNKVRERREKWKVKRVSEKEGVKDIRMRSDHEGHQTTPEEELQNTKETGMP